jgi:class 3 adenylate cyclase
MQARKTVSILFCDVVDSTPLGEQLDPESLQRVMSRWFVEARAIVERHGGTVEKFIGDEVMAVFGVPVVHEDDALRAVRSASALRDRLETLNDELEALFGVRLAVRIGVNTGEVVVGDPSGGSTFVTGEPVNMAKRLEQAAAPGQILIGKATYPLVANAVQAGPLESFRVKGKAEAVSPWEIEGVDEGAAGVARRLDAPLVGRETELGRLAAAFAVASGEPSCRLVTLLGPAGIGKTRLAEELRVLLGSRARVLTGRCLPYGDGITFWPLVELVRALGADGLETVFAEVEDRDAVLERLADVTGAPEHKAVDELFWAARRLVEVLAAERPLLLVFEDVDRGEPTFLDLLDYLHSRIDGAPVLVLCLARPELLDRRPAWSAPRARAEILLLEPLSASEAELLLAGLGTELDDAARERVLHSAEGNPLYVEQLAALAETGELVVPPTIQALLAERLDRLEAGERAILERAAIVGQEFSRRAVTDLCPPELRGDVGRHLLALARKELIRPWASASSAEDGFRFRHGLIRDVAYEGMPKEARALFHEWFADWMERNAGDRLTEVQEIVGYHLEQAVRLRLELGPVDARTQRLAVRAVEHLGASGRRAFARDDVPAAVNLLDRAHGLAMDESTARAELEIDLASACMRSGDFSADTEALLAAAAERAGRLGDRRLALRAEIEREFYAALTDPDESTDSMTRIAENAIPELEKLGDELGLAKAWWLLSEPHLVACRWGARAGALECALEHARRAGDAREVSTLVGLLATAFQYGPTPVREGIARCEGFLADAAGSRATEAGVRGALAALYAMDGDDGRARIFWADARGLYEELGMTFRLATRALVPGTIEMLAGDPAAAERELRDGYATLEAMGEVGTRATIAAFLAEAVRAQGRLDDAEELTRLAEATSSREDVITEVTWRSVRARALAGRDQVEAGVLAGEAWVAAKATDAPELQAAALKAQADVLAASGRDRESAEAVARARTILERKGNRAALLLLLPVPAG